MPKGPDSAYAPGGGEDALPSEEAGLSPSSAILLLVLLLLHAARSFVSSHG